MRSYLLLLVIAATVTYLATPAVRRLALAIGAYTEVRDRDVHSVPKPRLGGLAMLIGMAAAMVVGSQIPFLYPVLSGPMPWAVLASATGVTLVGAADDIWGLDAITRMAVQILAGLVLAWQGVQLMSLPINGLTVGSGGVFLALTVVAVVATVNAMNFIDGLDGLLAGVMAIAGSAYCIYTYKLTTIVSPTNYSSLATVLAAVTVGVCLGFLPHNLNPSLIFMGDSGAYLIGVMTASSAIIVTGQVDPTIFSTSNLLPIYAPLLIPLAVLVIPFLDLVLAVLRRVRKGRSPFSADRGHLHHKLLDLGHSHRNAVFVMYSWSAWFAYGAILFALVDGPWVVPVLVATFVAALTLTLWPRARGAVFGRLAGRPSGGDTGKSRAPSTDAAQKDAE